MKVLVSGLNVNDVLNWYSQCLNHGVVIWSVDVRKDNGFSVSEICGDVFGYGCE